MVNVLSCDSLGLVHAPQQLYPYVVSDADTFSPAERMGHLLETFLS